MEGVKPMRTPMHAFNPLSKGMIDSLLYLTTNKLDIMYSACLCVRF